MEKESHNYDHSHAHSVNKNLNGVTITFLLNFLFAIFELIIAILSNSTALLSNSIHDFGDSIILISTLGIERYSNRARTEKYTYGYRRFTLMGALINLVVIIFGSIIIIYNAIGRIINPEPIAENIIIFAAVIGIIINIVGYLKVRQNKSPLGNALAKNLFLDILSWAAFLLGAILIKLTNNYLIDSFLSLIIAFSMLFTLMKDLKQILDQLMQAVPNDVDLKAIEKYILSQPLIMDYHDLHIWNLDGEDYIATFHLVFEKGTKLEDMMVEKEKIRVGLEDYKLNHTTIEVDSFENAKNNNEIDVKSFF